MSRVAIVFALAACGSGKLDPSTTCGKLDAALATCEPRLSAAQLASFREVCPVYAAYRPEPNDSPDNLAAVVVRTLETCAKQTTCKAVSTCLGEGKCMWVYKSPTSDPLFMCM